MVNNNNMYTVQVENMCGLVEVGENWFGFLYSWSDNKKKSSLMLSLFEPGKRAAVDENVSPESFLS